MKKIICALLCICMLVGVLCFTAQAATTINIFDVTIDAPKVGQKPALTASLPETASTYVTNVEWKGKFDNNGNFIKGQVYFAYITVRVKDGQDKYIKYVDGKTKVNGLKANIISISEDKQEAVIARSFTAGMNLDAVVSTQSASDVNTITLTIPSPVAGQLPSDTASLQEGAKTTVSEVVWTGRLSHDGTFIAGQEYTVKLKVVIKSDYKQDSYTLNDASKITVNGNQATVKKENNREAYVTYTFTAPIPEGEIDMSFVLTKEQADYYFVDNHNDEVIVDSNFYDYLKKEFNIIGRGGFIDDYFSFRYNVKNPDYQTGYFKRVLIDYPCNEDGMFPDWCHELKEVWFAPKAQIGGDFDPIGFIDLTESRTIKSYYGSGGANVGTFKVFLSKEDYPDGWFSVYPELLALDTEESLMFPTVDFPTYLYEGDVYEAFNKGESAATLWCPGHKFVNPIITADRVAQYMSCQGPTRFYYSCKYCTICEYNPNHTFAEADHYDVYRIERSEHIYSDRVLDDKNFAGINAEGEKVYFKQCIYCGQNPRDEYFNYTVADFNREYAEFIGKSGYEYVTYEWKTAEMQKIWDETRLPKYLQATTKTDMPDSFAVYADRETTAKTSGWATGDIRWATQLQLTDKALLGEDYTIGCTREQFVSVAVKMAEKMLGTELGAAQPGTFADTDSLYVRKAVHAGITNGTSATTFSPNDTLTRAQMATFLYRTLQYVRNNSDIRYTVYDSALANYHDSALIPDWALKPMEFMNALGLIKGTSDTTIDPNSTCTIEQAVIVAYRSLDADEIGWYQSVNEKQINSRGYEGGTANKLFSVGIGGAAAYSSYTNADRYWCNKPFDPANNLDSDDMWKETNALPVIEPYTGIQSSVPKEDFMPIKDV